MSNEKKARATEAPDPPARSFRTNRGCRLPVVVKCNACGYVSNAVISSIEVTWLGPDRVSCDTRALSELAVIDPIPLAVSNCGNCVDGDHHKRCEFCRFRDDWKCTALHPSAGVFRTELPMCCERFEARR